MERKGTIPKNFSKHSNADSMSSLEENGVNLQWKDITYKTPDGITILNGLCGTSYSGELNAIMGPSGSGKTSLVNILSGFSQKGVTGDILVNGAKRDMNIFRKLTSYILQDDYVLPQFTVREIITYASKLKISASEKERQKAVNDCIYGLGLVGQQDQRANTLSGGQKKRLCIAQEIVNNPPFILLDEPTSGLDSASCLQCIMLLKKMAEKGKNIICTIHQPSSKIYEIFDNLYMISDGDCIYKGPTKDLLPYLEDQGLTCPKYHSPTDFLTDIAIGLYGDSVIKLKDVVKAADGSNPNWNQIDVNGLFQKVGNNCRTSMMCSIMNRVTEISQETCQDMTNSHYATGNFNQFRVLFERYFHHQLRDPVNMNLKIFGSILIGLFLGVLYYDTGDDGNKIFPVSGLLFTFMIFTIITTKVPTVLTFPLQRTIFEREHRNGWYSIKMYYLATTAAEVPFQILCPAASSAVLYWLSGLPMEASRFCLFLLSYILIALISESIGLMIGAVANVQDGIMIAGVLCGVFSLLNGFFMPLSATPVYVRWLSFFSFTRYALQSVFFGVYLDRPNLKCNKVCSFKDPGKLLAYFEMDKDSHSTYYKLVFFLFIFRILAFLMLQFKASRLK